MGEMLLQAYCSRAIFEHVLKKTLRRLEKDSAKQLSKTELDAFVNEQVSYIQSDLHQLVNQCHHQSKRCHSTSKNCHSVTPQCHPEKRSDARIQN